MCLARSDLCTLAVLIVWDRLWGHLAQDLPVGPKLLLTPQRLRRLERDRERQTVRWTNFESRVKTAPDSPERGFELALYYAVTHDEEKGRAAIEWAMAHRCETRQVALIVDWCKPSASSGQLSRMGAPTCGQATPQSSMEELRDEAFHRITNGNDQDPVAMEHFKPLLSQFEKEVTPSAEDVYALCELIDGVRGANHVDLRETQAEFFAHLPTQFLLGMKPQQVDGPSWRARIAGQILVAIDPNLQESQFLQGWAMEQREMISEGEGVAYEFLWGNPYLPGVSYQNLDPWVYYEADARLFARTDWTTESCWVSISPNQARALQCPPGWRTQPMKFGHLTLIPALTQCFPVPSLAINGDAVVVWGLKPGQKLTFRGDDKQQSRNADAAGMIRIPVQVQGKVCAGKSHE